MNRTLVETARCLCFQSTIPSNLWSETIKAACYLINRRPTKKINHLTPKEVFTGKKVDISNLRTFGTRVFVHIPKHQRDKLGKKSLSCTLLGFDEHTKGYRCYCPSTRKVLISRDVTIDEDHLGEATVGTETGSTFPYAEFKILFSSPPDRPSPTLDPDTSPPAPVIAPTLSPISHQPSSPYSPEPSPTPPIAHPIVQSPVPSLSSLSPSRGLSSPCNTLRVYARKKPIIMPTIVRRSTRLKRPSVLLDGFVGSIETDSLTFKQACKNPQWMSAMKDEIDSLHENNTWKLTTLPPGKKAITSKWIYKIKPGPKGSSARFKARLVARGFQQTYGIDFFETYAAVAKYNTIKIIAALMGTYGWLRYHLDIKTAFLNSSIKERVFMKQPQGWVVPGKQHLVCELNKSLYGLKQSPRN
jgi:hypothetical protein